MKVTTRLRFGANIGHVNHNLLERRQFDYIVGGFKRFPVRNWPHLNYRPRHTFFGWREASSRSTFRLST
jgi:hypothetical protein